MPLLQKNNGPSLTEKYREGGREGKFLLTCLEQRAKGTLALLARLTNLGNEVPDGRNAP